MVDKQEPTPPQEKSPEEVEREFWDRSKPHLRGILDEWFEEKSKTRRDQGTSRTGRTTLPGLFADMIFGPGKE